MDRVLSQEGMIHPESRKRERRTRMNLQVGEIAFNYLTLNPESYLGIEDVVDATANDLVNLDVDDRELTPTMLTIAMGVEEDSMRKLAIVEPGVPDARRRETKHILQQKFSRLGALLEREEGSRSEKIESLRAKGKGAILLDTFTPTEEERRVADRRWNLAEESCYGELSAAIKTELLASPESVFAVLMDNYGYDREEIKFHLKQIDVIMTRFPKAEFQHLFEASAFAQTKQGIHRIVMPFFPHGLQDEAFRHFARHELGHQIGGIRRFGPRGMIESGLDEAINELFANIPGVTGMTGDSARKQLETMTPYDIAYFPQVKKVVDVMAATGQLRPADLCEMHERNDLWKFDTDVVSTLGLSLRANLGFMKLEKYKERVVDELFIDPSDIPLTLRAQEKTI